MRRDPEVIQHEVGIHWDEDISRFDYVREYLELFAGTRRGPVRWTGPGRRVGYSVLKADAPSGDAPARFARRVFWVKEHDRSERPEGPYKVEAPAEGVDPRTVGPGVWGELTDRAWGAPLPQPGVPSSRPSHSSRKAGPPSQRASEVRVGQSSLSGGSAFVGVAQSRRGDVEIYIDCASGTELGDGSHIVSETLPPDEARARLVGIVKTTPWLQEALAISVVDQWLERGTAPRERD
ncbi:DUF6009 family protein [Kitasatospora sp. NPDC048365]|uniref:DUF6009 family protein n=1 Tax=Kitasatospora sp. NPDC048365 TaxID=3364050 RepID=UPI00372470A2